MTNVPSGIQGEQPCLLRGNEQDGDSPGRGSAADGRRGGRGGRSGRGSSSSKAGGGGGRGRGKKSPPPLQVFTTDFESMRRSHPQISTKFKVHRPSCNCPKVKQLLKRVENEQKQEQQQQQQHVDSTIHSDQQPQHPEQDLAQLVRSGGLLVIPEGSIPAVYLCLGTGLDAYEADPQGCERKLRDKIYGNPANGTPAAADEGGIAANADKGDDELSQFKLSCAACLLVDCPNGFACVSSPSLPTVELARDMARKRQQTLTESGKALHADHAHGVAAVSRRSLWALYGMGPKTRSQVTAASNELVAQLRRQAIIPPITSDEDDDNSHHHVLNLGHHVKSLLANTSSLTEHGSDYWLVIIHNDGVKGNSTQWSIDLPGGKRHLGESTWKCLVRETREETSLDLQHQDDHHAESYSTTSWEVVRKMSPKSDLGVNEFYLLRPPAGLLEQAVLNDPFWNTRSNNEDI